MSRKNLDSASKEFLSEKNLPERLLKMQEQLIEILSRLSSPGQKEARVINEQPKHTGQIPEPEADSHEYID